MLLSMGPPIEGMGPPIEGLDPEEYARVCWGWMACVSVWSRRGSRKGHVAVVTRMGRPPGTRANLLGR